MAQSSNLPLNPAGLYWDGDGYNFAARPRITTYPTTLNIINLSFATYHSPGGLPTGAVGFVTPNGTAGTNLNADIVTCRARGQRVRLSVGGGGSAMVWASQAESDNFIQSIKDINVQLGGSGTTNIIDGLDFNTFEGLTLTVAQINQMVYIAQQLKAYYGDDFIISIPPGGGTGGQATTDRLLGATMYANGVLDWITPQYYDGPGQPTQTNIQNTTTFWNTAVNVTGFGSVTIPKSYIGVGFGIDSTNPDWWTASGAATAYTNIVTGNYQPKGAINWAASVDPTNTFNTTVVPVLTNNGAVLAFAISASGNITDGEATTARLTPPSGKTTADFTAGRISDVSNPAASVDIGNNQYTEMAWCLQATAQAVNAAVYEFRITAAGTPLNTYTVTPTWTIGSPPTSPPAKTTGMGSFRGVHTIKF